MGYAGNRFSSGCGCLCWGRGPIRHWLDAVLAFERHQRRAGAGVPVLVQAALAISSAKGVVSTDAPAIRPKGVRNVDALGCLRARRPCAVAAGTGARCRASRRRGLISCHRVRRTKRSGGLQLVQCRGSAHPCRFRLRRDPDHQPVRPPESPAAARVPGGCWWWLHGGAETVERRGSAHPCISLPGRDPDVQVKIRRPPSSMPASQPMSGSCARAKGSAD